MRISQIGHVLLNTGAKMPILGLGTFQGNGDRLCLAVDYALHVGYRHIDTAASYQNEQEIGQVVNEWINKGKLKRKDIFITTKIPGTHMARPDVKPCLEESLENLKLKYVDLLLIHFPWGRVNRGDGNFKPLNQHGEVEVCYYDTLETWHEMEKCYASGLTKAMGVSNFSAEKIDHIWNNAKIKPANIQSECQAYYQQYDLKSYCDTKGISFTAYGSLGAPSKSEKDKMPILLKEPIIQNIAEKLKKTPAQVLLRNLIQRNFVVIPKSTTLERIEENFKIFDFELSQHDMDSIKTLDRGLRFYPQDWAKALPNYDPSECF